MKSWTRFPFARYTVALSAGITAFLTTESRPGFLWGACLASAAVAIFFFAFPPRSSLSRAAVLRGGLALLFLSTLGWLLAGYRSERTDATHFQRVRGIEAYQVVLTSQPESKRTYFRSFGQVRRVRTASGWHSVTGKVLLSLEKDVPRPAYGDVLLVRGAPQPVRGPLNPGEFDYRRYLRFQQVFHRDFVKPTRWVKSGVAPPNAVIKLACQVNRHADSVFVTRLGDHREYGVAKAMLLGVRDDLDAELMRAYSAAGAIHVLSVSGLHVGMLFVLLGGLLNFLKKRGWAGIWIAVVLKLLFLWSYALLTGLSPAVLRSATMFSMFILAEAFKRPFTAYNTLFASAFGLLVIDPFLLAFAGFQLSYLAVLGLIYLQPRIERWWRVENFAGKWLWKITATALAAQLATFPLAVYYFHQFPVYFLFINPVIIGLAGLAVPTGLVFLVLENVPLLNNALQTATQALFWLLNEATVQTERLPHAIWANLQLNVAETTGAYGLMVSVLALFFTRRKAYAWLAASLAVVLSGGVIFQKLIQHRQTGLVIHHVPQHSAVSFIDGNTLAVLADSAAVRNPRLLDYACAGFWAERGVRFTRFYRLDDVQRDGNVGIEAAGAGGFVLRQKTRSLLALTQPTHRITAQRPLSIALVTGSAGRKPFVGQPARVTVLDGAVAPWQVGRWRERGTPVYATSERGAWIAGF